MARRSRKGNSNIADVKAFLNKIEGIIHSEINSSVDNIGKEIAQQIYEKSQEYVPEDTGDLKDSAKIIKNNNGQYNVIYGIGLERGYAFYVHENIRTDEPKDSASPAPFGAAGKLKNYTKPGTGPKYLERAVDEVANNSEVLKYVRDELGRFKKRIRVNQN